jgi:serine/threonine-protein kinase RIO1
VIFSSQLNKVVAVLAEGPDNVHLSLLRIYLNWKEDSKVYEGVKFSGEEMLINLYRYYISSFKDLD